MHFKLLLPLFACLLAFSACEDDEDPFFSDDELDIIELPDGIQPEGIVNGAENIFYVGSLASGRIYRGDFRTGSGGYVYNPGDSSSAVGLAYNDRWGVLYVARGGNGDAIAINGRTNEEVARVSLGEGFVNDVIQDGDTAYFTNSFRPEVYAVALDDRGVFTGNVRTIPLTGDFESTPNTFNANGIEVTPDGNLIVVNSSTGALYNVDPATGVATLIDLGGASLTTGDGILLEGRTLYVVRNTLNQVDVVSFDADYLRGSVSGTLTEPEFDVPTTITALGNRLYVVNARFNDAPPGSVTPNLGFDVIGVDR